MNGTPTALNGGIRRAFGYDEDGQLVADTVRDPVAAGASPHPVRDLRNTSFTYDARGKLVSSSNANGLQDVLNAQYTGLGHLTRSTYTAQAIETGSNDEPFVVDALGNQDNGRMVFAGAIRGFSESTSRPVDWIYFADGTGRLAEHLDPGSVRIESDSRQFSLTGGAPPTKTRHVSGKRLWVCSRRARHWQSTVACSKASVGTRGPTGERRRAVDDWRTAPEDCRSAGVDRCRPDDNCRTRFDGRRKL